MPTLSIRATGLEKIQVGLGRFAQALAPVTTADAKAALDRAAKVSPGYLGGNAYTTPESGYVRTGNLGRSTTVFTEGFSARLEAAAYSLKGYEYAHLVVGTSELGSQGTPWANIGWVPLRVAVDAEIDKLTTAGGELDKDIGQAAKEAGL